MLNALHLSELDLTKQADCGGIAANVQLSQDNKADLGQYMTPMPVAAFMASLFQKAECEDVRLLDPGAGVGSLTSAFVEQLLKNGVHVPRIDVKVHEIDSVMLPFLKSALAMCDEQCRAGGIALHAEVDVNDFICDAVRQISDSRSLWGEGLNVYTHCIMNPPYKKIRSASLHRRLLSSVGIETVNLYSAFMSLAIKLLAPGGGNCVDHAQELLQWAVF